MLELASKCCDVFAKSLDRFTKVTEEFNQYLKEKSNTIEFILWSIIACCFAGLLATSGRG